jgi:hypothetical protein
MNKRSISRSIHKHYPDLQKLEENIFVFREYSWVASGVAFGITPSGLKLYKFRFPLFLLGSDCSMLSFSSSAGWPEGFVSREKLQEESMLNAISFALKESTKGDPLEALIKFFEEMKPFIKQVEANLAYSSSYFLTCQYEKAVNLLLEKNENDFRMSHTQGVSELYDGLVNNSHEKVGDLLLGAKKRWVSGLNLK